MITGNKQMKIIILAGCILLLSIMSSGATAEESTVSCKELVTHLENAKKTESFLLITKFNRSSTTTIDNSDGQLWEMWQKLQRLKEEKTSLFKEMQCERSIILSK